MNRVVGPEVPFRVPAGFKVGVARARPEDGPDLEAFRLRTFGPGTRQVDRARCNWLTDLNPYTSQGDGPGVWMCRRGGAVVGQQGEVPFMLRVAGQDVPATWAVDLMVEDAWRLHGVGPALFATMLEERPLVAAMNMSDQGYALMERAGCTDLGVIPVYVRPLRPVRAARLAGPVSLRRGVLAGAVAPLVRGMDGGVAAALRLGGLGLVPVPRLDARVDEVWERARDDYAVLARRDYRTLAWQIDQRPDRDLLQRFYLVQGTRTLGYVILRQAGTAAAPTAVVVDYLARARWVASLLSLAGRVARRRGAVAMSVKTRNERADRGLRAAGFLRRQGGADDPIRFMVVCRDGRLAMDVGRPHHWFVTSADCDLEYAMTPDA